MNAPATQVLDSFSGLWGLPLQPAGCPVCKQVYLLDPDREKQLCPLCGMAFLAFQPGAWLRPATPELLVPYNPNLSRQIPAILEAFTKDVWLKPDDFNAATLQQRLRPVYETRWLVDGQVVGSWQAEHGFDYQVKSSQDSYSSGSWRSREMIETRIRWEARLGQVQRTYQNISVPAFSRQDQLETLAGGYDTRSPAAYSPSMVGQAAIHVPDLQPDEIWQEAQNLFNQAAAVDIQTASQAQHSRNVSIHATYESLNWTQMLLPLYSTFYRDDDGQMHTLFINGQTGQIGGVRLASQRKGWQWAGILGGSGLFALLAAILFFFAGALFPPAVLLGFVLIIAAIILGISAIFPAVSPWQWNRSQYETPWFSIPSSGEVSKK
jgi:hypothetical protein